MNLTMQGIPFEEITYVNLTEVINSASTEDIKTQLLDLKNLVEMNIPGISKEVETALNMTKMLLSKDFATSLNNAYESQDSSVIKAKATLMLIMFDSKAYDEIEMGDLNNQIVKADLEIVDIIEDTDFVGVEYMGVNEAQYIEYVINSDPIMGILFLLVIVVIAIILAITYRSVLDTILSLVAIFLAIIWMNAIGILLGLTFGMMYSIVPIILIGIGVDYAIHITMRYKEGRDRQRKAIRGAMLLAIATIGASLFLSALTTGISFSSNMVSSLAPMREFGLFLMIGIFCAFFVIITFIPSIKVLVDTYMIKRQHMKEAKNPGNPHSNPKEKNTTPKPEKKRHKDSKILTKVASASARRPYPIMVVAIVSAILFGYFAMQLTTEFDFKEWLPRESQLTDDITYTFDNFDFGAEEVSVLIVGDDIATFEVLEAMDETQRNIETDKHVNEGESIKSIMTIIQDIRTPGGDFEVDDVFLTDYNTNYDINNDGLPDQGTDIEALFDTLRTNETYGPAVINVLYYNDGNYQGALIRVSVDTRGGDNNGEIYEEMNDNIEPFDNVQGTKAYATGQPLLMHILLTSIQDSGMTSLAITIIIAWVILSILFIFEFRSFSLGIMTLIPVILCICWVFGTMFLFGLPLTVLTIFVSTLTIGIGVDYGIHITNRFMECIHDYGNVDDAMKVTIVNTGGALGGAAITTIGGFIILYMAPTDPMRMFGAITAVSIGFSLVGSIFILPAFLGVYAKRKMAKDPKYFEKHVDIQAIRDHVSEHIHDFDKNLKYVGKVIIDSEHEFAHKISDFGQEVDRFGKGVGKAAGKAGKQLEKGAREAGKKVGDAGRGVGKAMDETGKKLDKAAKKMVKDMTKKK
jgi:predicted RND superfamily exporter protein